MWRTFVSYYCEKCRDDIPRSLWAHGGTCPTCCAPVPAHVERAS